MHDMQIKFVFIFKFGYGLFKIVYYYLSNGRDVLPSMLRLISCDLPSSMNALDQLR